MPERATAMSRAEKSAEAVVAASTPEATRMAPDGEGPNGRESGTNASLGGSGRQMAVKTALPSDGRGEAPRGRRSGAAPTATSGNGRSGSDRLMEKVVERANARHPPQTVEAGKDRVPGAARSGHVRARGRHGRGQHPPLVEERGHAHPCRAAHEVLRRLGGPTSCELTSTSRTARRGPACRVVWEGRSGRTAIPYPDSSRLCTGPSRSDIFRPCGGRRVPGTKRRSCKCASRSAPRTLAPIRFSRRTCDERSWRCVKRPCGAAPSSSSSMDGSAAARRRYERLGFRARTLAMRHGLPR